MRKVFIVLFYVLLTQLVVGQNLQQNEKKSATKIESVLLKRGNILIKDFFEIGSIQGRYATTISIKALVLSTTNEAEKKTKGLKIEITKKEKYSDQSKSAFWDIEELESLLKALNYFSDLSQKWLKVEKQYSEVIFSSEGDL